MCLLSTRPSFHFIYGLAKLESPCLILLLLLNTHFIRPNLIKHVITILILCPLWYRCLFFYHDNFIYMYHLRACHRDKENNESIFCFFGIFDKKKKLPHSVEESDLWPFLACSFPHILQSYVITSEAGNKLLSVASLKRMRWRWWEFYRIKFVHSNWFFTDFW